ncbi:hypothetical protein MKW92_022981 [Papaver armeniacum]|nr:hypothetical protein MKW92_022981 [Papaver armeniacum]
MKLHDLARKYKEESRGYDPTKFTEIKYTDGYFDYDGECFYDDDDGEWSELSSPKKKSDISGTRMDKQSNFHHPCVLVNMDIENGASEENMATERKKKEKRKSQEDGVESEQNDGIEIAIEVKKKKDSISKSNV